jgi:hypothetical protein
VVSLWVMKMVRMLKTALLAACFASVVVADNNNITCNTSQQCPSSAPCCSREFFTTPAVATTV